MESSLAFLLIMVYVLSSSAYSLLVKLSGNRLVLFGAVNGLTMLLALPLFFVIPLPDVSALPYVAGSALAYNAVLYFSHQAYKRADLSVVFPVRRAVSFLLVLLGAKFLLSEEALWYEWLGFSFIFLGILMQVSLRQLHKIEHTGPFLLMVLAAVASATQYIIDFAGIRHSENPFSFILALMYIGLPVTVWAYWTHRQELRMVLSAQKYQILISSLLDNIGYACFLYAVYVARALYAIPLTSLSVVVVTCLGLFHLKESMRIRRLLSASIIAMAITLVHIMDILYK